MAIESSEELSHVFRVWQSSLALEDEGGAVRSFQTLGRSNSHTHATVTTQQTLIFSVDCVCEHRV